MHSLATTKNSIEYATLKPLRTLSEELPGYFRMLGSLIRECGVSMQEGASRRAAEPAATAIIHLCSEVPRGDALHWDLNTILNRLLEVERRGMKAFNRVENRFDKLYLKYVYSGNERLRGIQILEYSPEVSGFSEKNMEKIRQLSAGLVIDHSVRAPQEGIFYEVSAKDQQEVLHSPNSRFFTLKKNNNIGGYYILITELGDASSCLQKTLNLLIQENKIQRNERVGWFETVGISKDVRNELKNSDLNAYDLIHEAAIDSAKSQYLDKIFAHVRGGEQANTALEKHLRRGWKMPGLTLIENGMPYHIIEYDLTGPDAQQRKGLQEEGWLPRLLPTQLKDRNVFSPRRRRDLPEIDLKEMKIDEAVRYVKTAIPFVYSVTPYQCTDGLSLVLDFGGPSYGVIYTMRQIITDRDWWSCESFPISKTGTLKEISEVVKIHANS